MRTVLIVMQQFLERRRAPHLGILLLQEAVIKRQPAPHLLEVALENS
jgi:hypothetical protein